MTEVMIQIEDELCTDEVVQFANEAKQCVELYSRKNHDYGNSFEKGMNEIGPTYSVGRIYDKVNRLIKLSLVEDSFVKDETVDDTLRDLACYAMMMLSYRKKQIDNKQAEINFE